MAAKYTLDMMGSEMELIAKRMREAQASDRDSILAQMDAVALRSAQLTGEKAEELKSRLDYIADSFEHASQSRFQQLSDQLRDSVVDILGNLEEIKTGQNRWGSQIMAGIKDLGCRIGNHVSTPVTLIEGLIAVIFGVVMGFIMHRGAVATMTQIYDENLTAIGQVPKFTSLEVWALTITWGAFWAIVIFCASYGFTKLMNRRKS